MIGRDDGQNKNEKRKRGKGAKNSEVRVTVWKGSMEEKHGKVE